MKNNIWTIIDPSNKKDIVQEIVIPELPTPKDIKTAITDTLGNEIPVTFASLSRDEKEELRILRESYSYERKKQKKQEEASHDLQIRIQKSVNCRYLTYTFNCVTLYEMLVNLKRGTSTNRCGSRARAHTKVGQAQTITKHQRHKGLANRGREHI